MVSSPPMLLTTHQDLVLKAMQRMTPFQQRMVVEFVSGLDKKNLSGSERVSVGDEQRQLSSNSTGKHVYEKRSKWKRPGSENKAVKITQANGKTPKIRAPIDKLPAHIAKRTGKQKMQQSTAVAPNGRDPVTGARIVQTPSASTQGQKQDPVSVPFSKLESPPKTGAIKGPNDTQWCFSENRRKEPAPPRSVPSGQKWATNRWNHTGF